MTADHFSDAAAVASYGDRTRRSVPGLDTVHRLVEQILAEAEMLALARTTLGALVDRVTLREGYVEDAAEGPFDGATCLLVLHFLPREERLLTLSEIRGRLRPGAPLLTFHHSVPGGDERSAWLQRYARFAAEADADPGRIARSAETLATKLPLLTPDEDEDLLREAGFARVGLFYAALTLRGWVAYA